MIERLALSTVLILPTLLVSISFLRADDDGGIGSCEKYTAVQGNNPSTVQIVDNKTKKVVFDLSGDELGSPYAAFFSEDGSLIAFSCGTSSMGTRLFIYRLDGKKGAVRLDLPDSIGNYLFGDHTYMKTSRVVGTKIYFNISNDGKAMPFVLDTKTGELREDKSP